MSLPIVLTPKADDDLASLALFIAEGKFDLPGVLEWARFEYRAA